MRLAIVSDIHANWQAWRAVLSDMQEQGVDGMLCLGDVVGYGPRPAEVLDDVHSRCENFVLGNHDAVIPDRLDPEIFSDEARQAIEWTRGKLDDSATHFFGGLPLAMEDDDILCVHAEAEDPERYDYIFEPEEALPTFRASTARLILCGHTHIPGVFAYDEETESVTAGGPTPTRLVPAYRYLINVGSVGDPRDGHEKACYCILDRDTGYADFRRVPFDYAAYRRELAATGLANVPYFLQVLDRKVSAASRVSDMDTGKLKRSSRSLSARTHAAQIHVDPGLLQQALNRRLVVPERKPLRTRTKVIVGLSSLAATLVLGVGLAWFAAYDRRTRYLPVSAPPGEAHPAERQPGEREPAVTAPAGDRAKPTAPSDANRPPAPPPREAGKDAPVETQLRELERALAEPDPARRPKPTPEPEPEPTPKPVPKPEPVPQPKPEPGPDPEPEAQAVAAPAPVPSADGLLAYEGFDYPHGNLAGNDGGIGWRGAWKPVAGNSGSVVAGNLSPDEPMDLAMTGNRTLQTRNSRSGRRLDTSSGGVFDRAGYLNQRGQIGAHGKTVYVSFLQQPDTKTRFWEFEFHRGDLNDRGRISGIGTDHNDQKVHLRGPHNPAIGPAGTDATFYVVRIDYRPGKDDVRVYRDPPMDHEPAARDAAVNLPAFQDMTFDGISLAAYGNGVSVAHDEIRIGGTYASVVPLASGIPTGVVMSMLRREFGPAVSALARRNAEHPDLELLRDLKQKLSDVDATILASFKKDIGKTVSVRLAGGKGGTKRRLHIDSVAGGTITCTLESGQRRATKGLSLDDLHFEEKMARLGGADSPVAWTYHGLLAMENGRPDVARKSFAKLGGKLGEALAAGVERKLLLSAREDLAELLGKTGIAADPDRLDEAADDLKGATLATMAKRRLQSALKQWRSEHEKRLGQWPAELQGTLKKLERVCGTPGRYGGAAPVSHWPMDGLSMTALRDKLGTRHGKFKGNVERRPGRARGALAFGGWGYVEVRDVAGLVSGDGLTWAAWIKTSSSGTIAAFTSSGGARPRADRDFFVDGKKLAFGVGHVGIVRSETEVADGKWHHVAVVLEGAKEVRFHVDGKPDGGVSLPRKAGNPPAGCVFKIGATEKVAETKQGFSGLIDDVMCYDRPLSPAEVTSLYEKQK